MPFALEDERVALKGGTAINLFHRDFPRLSVDIDLCYLPLESRGATYNNLHEILQSIKNTFTENDKDFLISFVSNKPDWSLVRDDKIKEFPSVKWKVFNQEKLELKDKGKHSK